MRWATLLVACVFVAAVCTSKDGTSTADRTAGSGSKQRRGGAEQISGDDEAAAPSPQTTATANGQTVSGRELLQASRARFTRPRPTVATAPGTPAATVPTTSPPVTVPPDGTVPADPPAASELIPSQELIAKALDEGDITWAQSVLYRAYALFWDPRLPERFDGIGSLGEDDFFTEARVRFADLDADTQAKLAPFLERPASPQGYGCPLTDNGQPVTWTDSGSASTNFKVWACATNGAADDIAQVVAGLDALYPDMTDPAAMGPPMPDTDGGDPRIDVYLLDVVPTRERNGTQKAIDGLTIAGISADAPFVGATASSYVMLGRPRVGDQAGLRRTLVHELFHALEYAHNYAVTSVEPGFTPWFFEASAAWAERQFAPAAASRVHADYFTSGFRTAPDLPLELPTSAAASAAGFSHPRWAYLWPFFMQQEAAGDAAAVFDTWDAVASATTWTVFHDAIDAQLPFATVFRDFAVRNLNLDLGPAIGPLYRDLDPAFPTGDAPTLNGELLITEPGTIVQPVGLRSLSTQYDQVLVTTRSNTRTLTLDFAGITNGIDVTVLSHANGVWTRHDLTPADVLAFDFDATGDVDQLYVILGNHDREPDWDRPGGAVHGGSYSITTAS